MHLVKQDYDLHAKPLPTLLIGTKVLCQNTTNRKWDRAGIIVEVIHIVNLLSRWKEATVSPCAIDTICNQLKRKERAFVLSQVPSTVDMYIIL